MSDSIPLSGTVTVTAPAPKPKPKVAVPTTPPPTAAPAERTGHLPYAHPACTPEVPAVTGDAGHEWIYCRFAAVTGRFGSGST